MNSNLSKTFVRLEISYHGASRKCRKSKIENLKFLLSWFILVIAHMLTLNICVFHTNIIIKISLM